MLMKMRLTLLMMLRVKLLMKVSLVFGAGEIEE